MINAKMIVNRLVFKLNLKKTELIYRLNSQNFIVTISKI